MIREMADVKTQYITKVVNVMRRIYREKWQQYESNGQVINQSVTSSSQQNSKYF